MGVVTNYSGLKNAGWAQSKFTLGREERVEKS